MSARRIVLSVLSLCLTTAWVAQAQQRKAAAAGQLYNTAKQKIRDGKQVICASFGSPEPDAYAAVANSSADCAWIEMQHSTMTYSDVAKLVWAGRGGTAIPMVRVPDATESDIQKVTDLGALGVIVPTVDTAEKAAAAVKWAKYSPEGRRSQGGGQAARMWGSNYRQTANDNMVVVIMIETPTGVENAEKIAAVPGIDVIFAASTDLGSFSGHPYSGANRQGDAYYESLVKRIHDVTLAHKIMLGGPFAWEDRDGFNFFQGPGLAAFVSAGGPIVLGRPGPAQGGRRGAGATTNEN